MRSYKETGTIEAPPRWTGAGEPLLRRDIDLRAVTPIYKGSARPDGIDLGYPFRGPALRGQLRAWWRAVHPTTTVELLRSREHALFGGVFQDKDRPRASRVALGLSQMQSKPAKRSELTQAVGTQLPYALWVDRDGTEVLYHLDASARLRVLARALPGDSLEDERQHLERALKALVLFGGSGSRSRRGLGRLWSDELLGSKVDDAEALAALIAPLCPPAGVRSWPSLAGVAVAWKAGAPQRTAALAADVALADFRELRGMKSLGGRNFDGSQRLPQAQRDWIRVRTHEAPVGAFTAALGMPLIYRSSNGHLNGTTTLVPRGKGIDRLPSPLHVRPVPTRGGWAAVILALQPWYTGPIVAANRSLHPVEQPGTLDPGAIDVALRGLAGKGWSVVRAGGAR